MLLLKYCKIVIMGTLGMPGQTDLNCNINLELSQTFIYISKI